MHVSKGKCSRTQRGSHALGSGSGCSSGMLEEALEPEYNPITGTALVHYVTRKCHRISSWGSEAVTVPKDEGDTSCFTVLKEKLSSRIISVCSGHGPCFVSMWEYKWLMASSIPFSCALWPFRSISTGDNSSEVTQLSLQACPEVILGDFFLYLFFVCFSFWDSFTRYPRLASNSPSSASAFQAILDTRF